MGYLEDAGDEQPAAAASVPQSPLRVEKNILKKHVELANTPVTELPLNQPVTGESNQL